MEKQTAAWKDQEAETRRIQRDIVQDEADRAPYREVHHARLLSETREEGGPKG